MGSLLAFPKLIKEGGRIVATFLLAQKIKSNGSSTGKVGRHNTSFAGKQHGPDESIIPAKLTSRIPGDALNRIA